jgi:hypothetical protein
MPAPRFRTRSHTLPQRSSSSNNNNGQGPSYVQTEGRAEKRSAHTLTLSLSHTHRERDKTGQDRTGQARAAELISGTSKARPPTTVWWPSEIDLRASPTRADGGSGIWLPAGHYRLLRRDCIDNESGSSGVGVSTTVEGGPRTPQPTLHTPLSGAGSSHQCAALPEG